MNMNTLLVQRRTWKAGSLYDHPVHLSVSPYIYLSVYIGFQVTTFVVWIHLFCSNSRCVTSVTQGRPLFTLGSKGKGQGQIGSCVRMSFRMIILVWTDQSHLHSTHVSFSHVQRYHVIWI